MSKRPSSADERPLAKRSRRPPRGFRMAWPAPGSSQPSLGSPSNTSLFVTVTRPDEQRGILEVQNRILSLVPDPPTEDISSPSLSSEYDTSLPVTVEPNTEIQDKPKRKRNTTNADGGMSGVPSPWENLPDG